jgi:hypothetical protein
VFVLWLGLILMVSAVAGGYYLYRKGYLVADNSTGVTVLEVGQVCGKVAEHNTAYPQQIAGLLQKGAEAILAGDQAAGDKAAADATARAKEWTGKLRTAATQTDDAGLRGAITDLADKLKPVEDGDASPNDVKALVAAAAVAIAGHCPKASSPPTP